MTQPDWRLIEAENTDLNIRSVELIGEGWSCVGYLVNGDQVFKVPKLDCWDELNAEIAFLASLGEQLPLAVPRPLFQQRTSAAAPFGYAAYSYIPGTILDLAALSPEDRQAAIYDMAHFVRTLHDLQPDAALQQILYVEDHKSLAEMADASVDRRGSGHHPQIVRCRGPHIMPRICPACCPICGKLYPLHSPSRLLYRQYAHGRWGHYRRD